VSGRTAGAAGSVRPDPHVLVVLGATGDLARRKLLPGLFRLFRLGLLPARFRIVCSGRTAPPDEDTFLRGVRASVEAFRGALDDTAWREFAARITVAATDEDDGAVLRKAVAAALQDVGGDAACLFYLAVPPTATESVVRLLGTFEVTGPRKVVPEKPFGTDLDSARRLDATLHGVFEERQIYRIDHFLGKEAVLTDDPKIFADVPAKVPGPDFVLGRGRLRLDLLDPLLRDLPEPRSYPRGSWGPAEALRLPGERGWRLPDQ
jgi:glucose-6-phosphate 1-dehydrogenase